MSNFIDFSEKIPVRGELFITFKDLLTLSHIRSFAEAKLRKRF